MIPKRIHYCWLSGEEMPNSLKRCVASWRQVMPDYELVKWDSSRFDIDSNTFTSEAFRARKWAFASDYIRIHALYTEGGIYLDCDVRVMKRFDEFLNSDFFTSLEYHYEYVRRQKTLRLLNSDGSSRQPFTPKPGIGLQAAVIGGVKGHPFFKDCLDYYGDKHFVLANGEHFDKVIAPDIYAMIAEKYGFRYSDEKQRLDQNMLIMPSETFAGAADEASSRSYPIHYCAASWRTLPKIDALRRTVEKLLQNVRGSRAASPAPGESGWKS